MNLVFASGFLVPQELLGLNYFRDVRAHVTQAGHHALAVTVPPLGTCEERAQVLAAKIQQEFPAGSGPIHIIAHSMGGLDSRMIIGRNLLGLADPGRIASLTTLSTPHRGSPVADFLAGPKPTDARRILYDIISDVIGRLGVPTGALANLTTEAASRVPDAAATHPHIRYRSCFASGRSGPLSTSLLLAPTHNYIRQVTGQDNDGVVASESAKYGEFQQPTWQCDHADMIGYNLDTAGVGPPIFPHLAKIDAIIAQL